VVLCAFLLAVFGVDQLEIPEMEEKSKVTALLKATLNHTISDKRQMLLIPITMYSGKYLYLIS